MADREHGWEPAAMCTWLHWMVLLCWGGMQPTACR
jgi:hypothetical protein